MRLDEIKTRLNEYIGKKVVIKYNLGRNKYEEYEAKVKELYSNVFLVELTNEQSNEVKAFSYSDIATQTIKIKY